MTGFDPLQYALHRLRHRDVPRLKSRAEDRSRTGNNLAEEDGSKDQADPRGGDGNPRGMDLASSVLQAAGPQILRNTDGTGPGVARRFDCARGGDLVELTGVGPVHPTIGSSPREQRTECRTSADRRHRTTAADCRRWPSHRIPLMTWR